MIYLGVFGGAAAFFLWVLALRMTTPTRVANTMTVNPIAASLLAAIIVSEPIGWNLVVGPDRGRGRDLACLDSRARDKKMSRAKALLGCLLVVGPLTRLGFCYCRGGSEAFAPSGPLPPKTWSA